MPVPSASPVPARELLRDNVYAALRDAIVDGTLAPGERLRDTEIEAWLGVSRTPIREALLRLERAGLVVSQPGRATIIAPFDAGSTRSAQQVAASMHELAARLAVPIMTSAQLDELSAANEAFAAAIGAGDTETALAADDRFHDVFVRACGNPMVAEVLEIATPLLRRVERLRFGSLSGRDSVDQHADIIAAAGARDVEGTARLCRENWLSLSYVSEE
ncbi:GntR family transcriptional regulator [Microbacterium sp. NPDC055910]|uniref:GntR family transcriptional regulator n=1 Tax=Microbacterium sp. NPDC055910 TaxID=3345659 RepID=UPI0035D64EA7